jgi:hypothetical protein
MVNRVCSKQECKPKLQNALQTGKMRCMYDKGVDARRCRGGFRRRQRENWRLAQVMKACYDKQYDWVQTMQCRLRGREREGDEERGASKQRQTCTHQKHLPHVAGEQKEQVYLKRLNPSARYTRK